MTVVEVGMGVFILTHSSKPQEELHSFNQEPVWPANIQITLHVLSVCLDITSKNFQFDMPEELDTYCAPRNLHSSSDIQKRIVWFTSSKLVGHWNKNTFILPESLFTSGKMAICVCLV